MGGAPLEGAESRGGADPLRPSLLILRHQSRVRSAQEHLRTGHRCTEDIPKAPHERGFDAGGLRKALQEEGGDLEQRHQCARTSSARKQRSDLRGADASRTASAATFECFLLKTRLLLSRALPLRQLRRDYKIDLVFWNRFYTKHESNSPLPELGWAIER